MAGNKRPSFLKRQKEQARKAKAVEKREARAARRIANATGAPASDMAPDGFDPMLDGIEPMDERDDADQESLAPSEREPR